MILFYFSASAWGSLKSGNDSIMLYLEQPVTMKEADALMKQIEEAKETEQPEEISMPAFCIWGQKEDILLTNENLSKSTQADAVVLCGNPELVFNDCRMPVRDDREGCIIDEETAWDLFGSSEVIGKTVTYNNKQYFVRQVIKGEEKIFAFQTDNILEKNTGEQKQEEIQGQENPDSKDESRLNRVTLQKPEGYSVREIKNVWDNRTGITGTVMDIELLYGISGFCVLLVPITLCVIFLIVLLQQNKKQPERLAGKAVTVASALIIIGMILFLLVKWVEIPLDYIPTKWSDFSFWTSLWKEKIEAVKLLWEMPKTDLDYVWVSSFCQSAGGGILAEVILTMVYIMVKHRNDLNS